MRKKMAVFRADASLAIGSGHIMRCLVLADSLRAVSFDVVFICRDTEGNLIDYIRTKDYRVFVLPTRRPLSKSDVIWDANECRIFLNRLSGQIEWFIVDHYGIDRNWELIVKPLVQRIMVIDDLANRAHSCEVLLDQNAIAQSEERYSGLVEENCRLLLGPRYLLLKPSFYRSRRALRSRNGEIKRLLVFFGGTDQTNETYKVIEALTGLKSVSFNVDVVVGRAYSDLERIQRMSQAISNINIHVQVETMEEFIFQADFALGAGGVTMWERAYLGLPSAVTIVADNQVSTVAFAERNEAVWNLGWHDQINSSHYADILRRALNSPLELRKMSENGLVLMESRPDTAHNRVIEALLEEV